MSAPLFAVMLLVCGEVEVGDVRIVAEGRLVGAPAAAFGAGVYLSGVAGRLARCRGDGGRPGGTARLPTHSRPWTRSRSDSARHPRPSTARAFRITDGVFLVVWQDLRRGGDLDVRGVLVEPATGSQRGTELEVAVLDGNQARPAIAACGEGFLVVWQDAVNTGRGREGPELPDPWSGGCRRAESCRMPVPLTLRRCRCQSRRLRLGGESAGLLGQRQAPRRHGCGPSSTPQQVNLSVSLGTINAACQYGAVIAARRRRQFHDREQPGAVSRPVGLGWSGSDHLLASHRRRQDTGEPARLRTPANAS